MGTTYENAQKKTMQINITKKTNFSRAATDLNREGLPCHAVVEGLQVQICQSCPQVTICQTFKRLFTNRARNGDLQIILFPATSNIEAESDRAANLTRPRRRKTLPELNPPRPRSRH